MTRQREGDPNVDYDLAAIGWLQLFRDAIEASYDSVLITDAQLDPPGPTIVYANPAFTQMTQYSRDEIVGCSPRVLQGPETDRETLRGVREALEQCQPVEAKVINYRKDGSTFWIEWRITPVRGDDGTSRYFIAIQRDVTQRERMMSVLREQAEIDELTGAYNRRRGREILATELERARRYDVPVSVTILDIDHFKDVNDAYGHATGDEVLEGCVELAMARTRTNDVIARWGGEEFLVVFPHTKGPSAREAAEGLRGTVESAHIAGGVPITVSLGVAEREPGDSIEDLVARADEALYRAKHDGRNRVELG